MWKHQKIRISKSKPLESNFLNLEKLSYQFLTPHTPFIRFSEYAFIKIFREFHFGLRQILGKRSFYDSEKKKCFKENFRLYNLRKNIIKEVKKDSFCEGKIIKFSSFELIKI